MSSIESALQTLSERIRVHGSTIATEEAAKTSVVLPFLQALGYDVFNPSEIVPEFTADAVGKKGEKVDYAVRLDGEIKILIECKGLSSRLEQKHLSQLFRYFTVTKARFALLTNGQHFEFYTDLEEPNKLDARPFFSFDLLNVRANELAEIKKFEKSNFDVDKILATAERLKYVSAVKKVLVQQMEEPGPELTRIIAGAVYDGRITVQVRDSISAAIKAAYKEIIRDSVQERLSSALEKSAEVEGDAEVEESVEVSDIETTQEEIEGMLTIRAIVRNVISASRVGLRDARSYCAVLVDENNRKPLARMHFNRKQWYLSLFDGDGEDRVPISSLDEIYDYSDRLRLTAEKYKD